MLASPSGGMMLAIREMSAGSGVGAIAEGMDQQDPVGIQHPGSLGNRIRWSQRSPRYPKLCMTASRF